MLNHELHLLSLGERVLEPFDLHFVQREIRDAACLDLDGLVIDFGKRSIKVIVLQLYGTWERSPKWSSSCRGRLFIAYFGLNVGVLSLLVVLGLVLRHRNHPAICGVWDRWHFSFNIQDWLFVQSILWFRRLSFVDQLDQLEFYCCQCCFYWANVG